MKSRAVIMREIWRLAAIAGGGLFIGLVLGRPGAVLAAVLGVYLFATQRNLMRLHRWLLDKKRHELPEAGGLWGEVFNEIFQLEKEANAHRDRLGAMLTRFQEAAAALPDGMVILSRENEIEWANPAAERMLGLAFPRDGGQRIGNLVRTPAFNAYLRKHDYSESVQFPSPAQPDNTLSLQIVPYGASQRLLICRDITHVMRLEEMRRNFVANASHELRSPITVLCGYLETLQSISLGDEAEIKKVLATMHGQARRMERLVSDLLMLSRLETALPSEDRTVDVPAMVASLQESAQLLSGEQRHEITLSVDPNIKLHGAEEELRSVFSNLIDNAVRYTPAGGRIDIAWRATGEGAEFAVSDTGVGIAPQHIPHLTERFYRVDVGRSRETGGTGLGLAIVKHVLQRHEARLEIESTPGAGSTFRCLFPATRLVVDTAAQPHAPS